MVRQKNAIIKSLHPFSAAKCMLTGAAIGLILIVIFIAGFNDANPQWGKFWMIRPIMVVSFAGAMGGLFFYFMTGLRKQGGSKRAAAIILSLLVYIFGLWTGTILGLSGTLWD